MVTWLYNRSWNWHRSDGGKITIDGSSGIDIGVESDVPIDIDSSTLDVDEVEQYN